MVTQSTHLFIITGNTRGGKQWTVNSDLRGVKQWTLNSDLKEVWNNGQWTLTSKSSSERRGSALKTSPPLKWRTRLAIHPLFRRVMFLPQHWLNRWLISTTHTALTESVTDLYNTHINDWSRWLISTTHTHHWLNRWLISKTHTALTESVTDLYNTHSTDWIGDWSLQHTQHWLNQWLISTTHTALTESVTDLYNTHSTDWIGDWSLQHTQHWLNQWLISTTHTSLTESVTDLYNTHITDWISDWYIQHTHIALTESVTDLYNTHSTDWISDWSLQHNVIADLCSTQLIHTTHPLQHDLFLQHMQNCLIPTTTHSIAIIATHDSVVDITVTDLCNTHSAVADFVNTQIMPRCSTNTSMIHPFLLSQPQYQHTSVALPQPTSDWCIQQEQYIYMKLFPWHNCLSLYQ